MEITKDQTKFIQSSLSGTHPERDDRLDYLSNFFGYEITSTKNLTMYQAQELIHFLSTGEIKSKRYWGFFEKGNKQHSKILNLLRELEWLTEYNDNIVPDIERLGGWLQSFRAPVQKPLLKQDTKELTKTINALTGILTKQYKNT